MRLPFRRPDPLLDLEPLDWRPKPTLRERLLAAVGVPVIVGVVLFAGAVATAVLLAVAQPHEPAAAAVAGGEVGVDGDVDGEVDRDPFAAGQLGDDDSSLRQAPVGGTYASTDIVVVHIAGKVHRPGVLELPRGARVVDAIEAAGGATDERALEELNLARVLIDGERIAVVRGDTTAAGAVASAATATVSLNSATAEQLATLPRIGPQLAARIVEWRQAHGGFRSVDQLLQISGIGAKTLEGFREQVTL